MAGTVNQKVVFDGPAMRRLVFECTGDAADGTIPNTQIAQGHLDLIKDHYIYRCIIENLSTQTDVTANSDVYLYMNDSTGATNTSGPDLLNGQGVDALDSDTTNYIEVSESEPITGLGATLVVANQAEVSAQYTITLLLST